MRVSSKASASVSSQSVGASKGAKVSPSPVLQSAAAVNVYGMDALSVSGMARLMGVARAALASVPDIRSEKVESLREQLDRDAYQPDGEAVADGLLKEHGMIPSQVRGR